MPLPPALLAEAERDGVFDAVPRRSFVGAALKGSAIVAGLRLTGFGLAGFGLTACAGSRTTASGERSLPLGEWREPPMPKPVVAEQPTPQPPAAKGDRTVASDDEPAAPGELGREFNPVGEAALPWAKPRFLWAKGQPIRGDLNPMLPVTCVTVHHDGLDELFWGTRQADVAARLERYRVGHLARGWADIGYHLAIDRGGVLWQGRAIRWQGAHVHLHNEGNIGVLVMGNFDLQTPSFAQMATLRRVLTELRATYRIKRGEVYTHKEWKDAQTACPGASLQPRVEKLRKSIGA